MTQKEQKYRIKMKIIREKMSKIEWDENIIFTRSWKL